MPHGLGAEEPGLVEGPGALLAALRGQSAGLSAVEWVDVAGEDNGADPYARQHHLDRIFRINWRLAERVAAARVRQELPIVLGGDHSVAIGTWAGLSRALPGRRLGVLWIDAHPDLNTPETTPSHHAHGMPLAAIVGRGHPLLAGLVPPGQRATPQQVALVGIRSIDPGEAAFLAEHPELVALPAAEIQSRGSDWMLARLRAWLAPLEAVHLSLDLDALDPSWAPGVTTPVARGLRPAHVWAMLDLVLGQGKLVAADVVEYLPRRDRAGATAELAAEVVARLVEKAVGSRQ
ncbi:MAG: arginase [Chloroflexi bacterium]|nr:arginase [Chloroflexota bacterium]